ncbi:uncharacterized protein LOC119770247 [Culex quinquefasciatus]|uniref:uncharacterized protein LOC119770247 n=1 Tax=Culex quinquefasciatus TaxID=7176 RepID=UPI0018E31336|nr:uncharacterized protein LOC119770247 [Culex quinquefasciatus]XP_038120678.1 uncharacterized protein LOC119770247 [Culex quinquefasciatus]
MTTPKKRKKSNSSDTTDQRGSSSGIHCGIRGNEYQIFMTMYILLRAHNKYPLYDFRLMMERSESDAGKFDDIWLKVGSEQMFIQAKHNSVQKSLTKSMVLLEGDSDPFSLSKYQKSHGKFINPLHKKRVKNCWCILMTNLPLNKDLQDSFQDLNDRHMPYHIIGVGKLLKLKTKQIEKDPKKFEASDAFYEDFLLSAGKGTDSSNTNDTGKTRLRDLQKKIEDEIERLMCEDGEYAFHRLRVKLVKWVCDKEKRQNKEYINRKWVKDFIKTIKSDYQRIVNAYYQEFTARLEFYEHVNVNDSKVNALKKWLVEKNKINIILSFKESPIMRMKQAYQSAHNKMLTFVLFSRMQSDTIRTKMKRALKQEKMQNYVLILLDDCGNATNTFKLVEELKEDCENIIIISEVAHELANEYRAKNVLFKLDSGEITMADLSEESIDKLIKEPVSFQGCTIPIELLPNLAGFQSNLAGSRLEALIDRYPIEIGIGLPCVEARCSHYVPRSLWMSRMFFNTKQMEQNSEIRFVESAEDIDASSNVHYIILISEEDDLESIEEPIAKPKYFSVFMQLSEDYCYFKKSLGREKVFGKEVFKHKAKWCARIKDVKEEDFHKLIEDFPKKVIILAGDIGTGKSTTLLKLANIQKNNHPSTWIVYVDLNTETARYKEFANDALITKDFAVKLLSELIAVKQDRPYFEACMNKDAQNVVIYLDAFDEACPTYKAGVLKCIDVLVALGVQRVYVSTRSQYEQELERHFSTASYRLTFLTKKECVEMIESLWSAQEKTAKQAKAIVEEMDLKLKDIMQGVPLVLQMLSKISPHQVDRFLSDSFTLYDLFEVFMDNILKRYFTEKSKMNLGQNYIRSRDIPKLQQSYCRDFHLIAVKGLYSNEHVGRFFAKNDRDDWEELSRDSLGDLTCSEIIVGSRFVHQSYAEYYAAVFMYTKFIRAESMHEFWENFSPALVTDGLVSTFFYQKMESNNNEGVNLKMKQILAIITAVPLRYKCSRNYSMFLKYLLQNEMLNHVIKILTRIWIKCDPNRAIQAAVQFKQISLVKDIIQKQPSLKNSINASGQTLLHVAAEAGSIEIARELEGEAGSLSLTKLDTNGYDPIMVAYRSKQFEMRSYFLNNFTAVSLDSYKRTEARNMLLLLLLYLPNLINASIQILEKNDYSILIKIANDYILITTDYEALKDYIISIKKKYGTSFDEITNHQETESIKTFLQEIYPDPDPKKLTVTENAYQWNDIEIYNDLVFSINRKLKIFCVGYTQVEFNSLVYKQLSAKTLFRDPLYVLVRLQYKFVDFFKGIEIHGSSVETVISQLHQEALELHSAEAGLKYNKFQFKEPIPNLTNFEQYLKSGQKGTYFAVYDAIESARICQYLKLGNGTVYHVPGWMLKNVQIRTKIDEIIEQNKVELVLIHNLDCNTIGSDECENCKFILQNCQSISQKCKLVVSLKHPLPKSIPAVEMDLTSESINMIENYVISYGSNYINFHELHEDIRKYCITNGALEYIALNEPICVGQKHPFYFIPWMHRITQLNYTIPLADTFYGSLDKLLEHKFAIVSKNKKMVIPTCKKCADETDLFASPIHMLACEASWRNKTTLVLHADVISLSQIHNSLPNDTNPQLKKLKRLLEKWYRSEEDDPLNCSIVELYLRQSPKNVVLMIDAELDADLEENHIDLLKMFYTASPIRSVVVYVDTNDKIKQLEHATSADQSFKLYRLKEEYDKIPSIPKLFPPEARVCEHFRQHPFEIKEYFV